VADKFGKSASAADALYNAGLLRQALGDHAKAIVHYQAYAKRFKDRKDASTSRSPSAWSSSRRASTPRPRPAFRDFIKAYRGSARVPEATLRAARCALALGVTKRAADGFAAVLAMYGKAKGKDRTAMAGVAAEARYQQGELVFKDFEKISLAVSAAKLTPALEAKSATLKKAAAIYLSIADYKDIKWATAALYRAGQIFDGLRRGADLGADAEGMSEEDAQAYRDTLDLVVVDTQDSAVQTFSAGYAKAIQLQAYDEYTAKIRAALGRLATDTYPPEREGRAPVRDGDRPLTVELVTEVVR
jgi:tetratricopeptide (TPR) repeat protein